MNSPSKRLKAKKSNYNEKDIFLISLSALIVVSCGKSAKYELRADILGANNLVFDLKIIENNRMVTIDSAISKMTGLS